MKYLEGRNLFLFSSINSYLGYLDDIDDDRFNFDIVIGKVNGFLSGIPKDFVKIIFGIVSKYVVSMNLNPFGKSGDASIAGHIKNICDGIVTDYRVKDILSAIGTNMQYIVSSKRFDINNYLEVVNLIEELDFVCIIEIYSYLLCEDIDSVLNFVLNEFVESLYLIGYDGEVNGEEMLSYVESKLKLFRKLYDDEDIYLVSKSQECIIYRVNDTLKMIYV